MRGYQKRVIYLKNIESSVFEEAYLVIRPSCKKLEENEKEPNFINEANRIIEESVKPCEKKSGAIGLKESIFFITGFLISALICLFVF